jgi:autotransporter-associated beta strand protein
MRSKIARLPAIIAVLATSTFAQTTHTWQGSNVGDWSDPANWSTGTAPDAPGDTAAFTVNDAGSPLVVTLPADPVSIGSLNLASTISAPSVVFAASGAGSALNLATVSGQPVITSATASFSLNVPITGTQGWINNGPGSLSLRDNPHAHTYTGPIGLAGGKLVLGSDKNLGDPDNDLRVDSAATLIADPIDPTTPLVLGPGRALTHANVSAPLTLTNASAAGTLEIAGPVSGAGPLRFDGVGTLAFSGVNTRSGSLTHLLWPGRGGTGLVRESTLRFVGPDAVRHAGHNLVFDFGTATVTNSSSHIMVDLGGRVRALNLSVLGGANNTASSALIEITNGELFSVSTSLDLSARGSNTTTELRLPATTTLSQTALQIGTALPNQTTHTNHTRVRIGTQANFNLQRLNIGEAGSSGRLDALAPGATLRLRDGNGTAAMSSITVGNSYAKLTAPTEAILDLTDGVLDAQTNTLYIGNGAPPYLATARFRFGAGTLQAGNVTVGGGSSATPANFDYQIEQSAGTALIQALSFTGGNATGNVASRYTLLGGNLALGHLIASGNYTGTLRPKIEWRGGTLRNYPSGNTSLRGAAISTTPFEIVLDGPGTRYLDVEAGRVLQIHSGCKFVGTSADAVLTKTGPGSLLVAAQTANFGGTLRVEAGELALDPTNALTAVLNAGAFVWDSGTLSLVLSSSPTTSNRLALTTSLTKTTAPATTRVLNLRNSLGNGTHTLATYASTDLTTADFSVTGVRSGYSADFVVGPTALTVTLAPETAFAVWRRTTLAASANLGSAADQADPDGDGRPNLLEYALGTEPLTGDPAPPVVLDRAPETDRLALTFHRVADPALTYEIRAAPDPAGPWDEVVFSSTGTANTAGPITVEDPSPLVDHPRRFVRLFITR